MTLQIIMAGAAFFVLCTIVVNQFLITNKIEHFMAKSQERFDALMARLDKITTDIAGDYKTLLDEVKAGGVSDESFAKAEANIATLEALGASVENPIPETPVV